MKDSIRNKLENTRDRFEEIAGLLADVIERIHKGESISPLLVLT